MYGKRKWTIFIKGYILFLPIKINKYLSVGHIGHRIFKLTLAIKTKISTAK